jgi:anti-sigma regulatory factor (Ser/Thr protein kinase)
MVTLFRISATPVSSTGIAGICLFTLDLGAGVESITLGAEPASVGTARRFVLAEFAERALESSVAVLLTSELVSNVVVHARTQLAVVLLFDPCVRIEVHDGAAATQAFREILESPRARRPPESVGGRGLPLVRGLASRFGLSDEPGRWKGKIVWFELDPADLAIRRPADV